MNTPIVQMPSNLTPYQQLDWLSNFLVAKTEGPSCAPQKGVARGEIAVECAARLILEREAEIKRLHDVVGVLETELFEFHKHVAAGHIYTPMPVMHCPACGAPDVDMDGFGCLACPRDPVVCYCSHPATDDGVCGICKDSGARVEEERCPPNPWP